MVASRAFPSPSAALSSAVELGVVGNQLFELRDRLLFCSLLGRVLIAAQLGEQRKEVRSTAAGGVLFFGYFRLDKQTKVSRLSGRDPTYVHSANCRNKPDQAPSP